MCKTTRSKNRGLLTKAILIASFLLLFAVLAVLKNDVSVCEWYTRTIGRAYQVSVGILFKYIPFSSTEFIIAGLFIFAGIFLVSSIVYLFKKKFEISLQNLLNLLLLCSVTLTMYTATAEMAYNREELPINLYTEDVDKTEFKNIISYFINDLNDCAASLEFNDDGSLKEVYSTKEISDMANVEYERLNDNDYFSSFTTNCKPLASSFLFREFNIVGMTFMPTTEANINYLNTESSKPFTFVHELAHFKGVMREEDAQQLTLALCLSSENKLFRYSAYMATLGNLYRLAYLTGDSNDPKDLANSICSEYFRNAEYNTKYWSQYDLLDRWADWWNDLYLKMSGEEEGTESYNDTPTIVTPSKIYFSTYQKIYFRVYYGGDLFLK